MLIKALYDIINQPETVPPTLGDNRNVFFLRSMAGAARKSRSERENWYYALNLLTIASVSPGKVYSFASTSTLPNNSWQV